MLSEGLQKEVKGFLAAPARTGNPEFDSVVEYLSREIIKRTFDLVNKPEDMFVTAQGEVRGLLVSMEILKERVKTRDVD